jgi:hypothetical protein
MARFAPVAPIQVLEAMYDDSPETFGDYHLLLAHHTAQYEERFRALFRRIAEEGKIDPIVIMDNSVVETGGFVDFGLMIRATEVVADYIPNVIPVLPDVMGDGAATREVVGKDYRRWVEEMPGVGFMAVVQGANWDDYLESLYHFTSGNYGIIEFLGIPRVLVETIGTREDAVLRAVAQKGHTQRIHLLGYSDNMVDDLKCSQMEGVFGIDSAVPLRYPDNFTFSVDAGKRPEDWFETAEFTRLMQQNLEFVRGAHS